MSSHGLPEELELQDVESGVCIAGEWSGEGEEIAVVGEQRSVRRPRQDAGHIVWGVRERTADEGETEPHVRRLPRVIRPCHESVQPMDGAASAYGPGMQRRQE